MRNWLRHTVHHLIVLTLVVGGSVACSSEDNSTARPTENSSTSGPSTSPDRGTATEPGLVQPQDVEAVLAANPGITVIDARTPEEIAEGRLSFATVDYDFNAGDLQAAIENGTLDPGAKYLVYCRSGNRSAQAANLMESNGFTQVWDLDGGILAWEAAGMPLTTEAIS